MLFHVLLCTPHLLSSSPCPIGNGPESQICSISPSQLNQPPSILWTAPNPRVTRETILSVFPQFFPPLFLKIIRSNNSLSPSNCSSAHRKSPLCLLTEPAGDSILLPSTFPACAFVNIRSQHLLMAALSPFPKGMADFVCRSTKFRKIVPLSVVPPFANRLHGRKNLLMSSPPLSHKITATMEATFKRKIFGGETP